MPRPYDSTPASFAEASGTLTNTTASVAANDKRRGLIISNPSDTVMTASIGGTASATVGIVIGAGNNIVLAGEDCPSGAVSLFCAGTSKAYTIYTW